MQDTIPDIDRKHANLFGVILVVLIFGYPVSSFITDALGIGSNVLSVLTRALQVGLVAYYTYFLYAHQRLKVYNGWVYFFVVFWLVYAIRVIHDTSNYGYILGLEPKLYYLFGFVLSFLITIPLFVPAPIDMERLENWVYWTVIFLSVATLNKFLSLDVAFIYRTGANERLNPISTSFPSGLLLVLAFRRILLNKKISLPIVLLNLLLIALALFNLAVSSTKSVYIFSIVIILVMIARLIRSAKAGTLLAAITVVSVLVVSVVYYFSDYFQLTVSRFTEVDASSEERIAYIQGAINQFFESPFVGSFLEEKTLRAYPHNPVLESYMALGIIGGTYFLVYFIRYAINAVAVLFYGSYNIVAILGFSVLVISLVSGSLCFYPEFWYLSAIFTALPDPRVMANADMKKWYIGCARGEVAV